MAVPTIVSNFDDNDVDPDDDGDDDEFDADEDEDDEGSRFDNYNAPDDGYWTCAICGFSANDHDTCMGCAHPRTPETFRIR